MTKTYKVFTATLLLPITITARCQLRLLMEHLFPWSSSLREHASQYTNPAVSHTHPPTHRVRRSEMVGGLSVHWEYNMEQRIQWRKMHGEGKRGRWQQMGRGSCWWRMVFNFKSMPQWEKRGRGEGQVFRVRGERHWGGGTKCYKVVANKLSNTRNLAKHLKDQHPWASITAWQWRLMLFISYSGIMGLSLYHPQSVGRFCID